MKVFRDLTTSILAIRSPFQRPIVVGISGIDASGKTTFSTNWAEYLQERGYSVCVVHLDDFHNPREIRKGQGESAAECYYKYTFDFDRLTSEVLEPIRRRGELRQELLLLDLLADTYTVRQKYEVNRDTIVIVEGCFLFKDEIINHLDYKIYLDIDFDECLRRTEERDQYLFGSQEKVRERYKNKYIPGQKIYLEKDRPKAKADIVINN